jgi:hypothetical protein
MKGIRQTLANLWELPPSGGNEGPNNEQTDTPKSQRGSKENESAKPQRHLEAPPPDDRSHPGEATR